jgi:hypothetical protein
MEKGKSLREWAKENKIWKPESWRIFLVNDLVPFYKQAYTLHELYWFLKSKACGRPLADIEDEELRKKIKVAIYGGAGKNPETSFAKFMYENFGIRAEDASSFEDSLKYFENFGDGVKVSLGGSWIDSIGIENLVKELRDLITKISPKINAKLSEIGLQDSYPYPPAESIDPRVLLPNPGESPEKLLSLFYGFKQKALDLSLGINPFVTFVFYSRSIPLLALMEFLQCSIEDIKGLAEFLGLKPYSMLDGSVITLPTKTPETVFLQYNRYDSSSVLNKIIELHDRYLIKIDPSIKQSTNNYLKEITNQIRVNFEPWEEYKPIFDFIKNKVLSVNRNWCKLGIKNGRIEKVSQEYLSITLQGRVWLRDFLLKIYPIMSAGLAEVYISPGSVELIFEPLAKDWVERVIENEGKA